MERRLNFFYLDEDPFKSIEYHCDKHIVKMPTEYKQMLCTAHRVLDGELYIDRTKNGARIKRWKHPDQKMNKHLYLLVMSIIQLIFGCESVKKTIC